MDKNDAFPADASLTTSSNTMGISLSSHASEGRFSTVRFKDITVREYNLTIGNNPFCNSGCPISLGRQVLNQVSIPIEEYEQTRAPRRGQSQMRIPKDVRQHILMNEWHIPFSQILEQTTEIAKIREKRQKNLKNYYRRKNRQWKNILRCRSSSNDVIVLSSNGANKNNTVDESQMEIPFLQPKPSLMSLSKLRNSHGEGSYVNDLDISLRGKILLDDMDNHQRQEGSCQGLDVSNQTIQINNTTSRATKGDDCSKSAKTDVYPDTTFDLDVSCRRVNLLDLDLGSHQTQTLTDETDEDTKPKDAKTIEHTGSTVNTTELDYDLIKHLLLQAGENRDDADMDHLTSIIIENIHCFLQQPDVETIHPPTQQADENDCDMDSLDTSSRRIRLDHAICDIPPSKSEHVPNVNSLDSSSRRIRLDAFDDDDAAPASLDSSSRRIRLPVLDTEKDFSTSSKSKPIPSTQPEDDDLPISLDVSSRRVRLLPQFKKKETKNGNSLDVSLRRMGFEPPPPFKNEGLPSTSLDSPSNTRTFDISNTTCKKEDSNLDSLDHSSRRVKLLPDFNDTISKKHTPSAPLESDNDIHASSSLDFSLRRVNLPLLDTTKAVSRKEDTSALPTSSSSQPEIDYTPDDLDTSSRFVKLSALDKNNECNSIPFLKRDVTPSTDGLDSFDSLGSSSMDVSLQKGILSTTTATTTASAIGRNETNMDSLDVSIRRVRL